MENPAIIDKFFCPFYELKLPFLKRFIFTCRFDLFICHFPFFTLKPPSTITLIAKKPGVFPGLGHFLFLLLESSPIELNSLPIFQHVLIFICRFDHFICRFSDLSAALIILSATWTMLSATSSYHPPKQKSQASLQPGSPHIHFFAVTVSSIRSAEVISTPW